MAVLALEVEGRVIPLGRSGTLTIGRSPEASVVVSTALASRQHFELTGENGVWQGRDLGTLNGTFVNGALVPSGATVQLRAGMTVMLGDPTQGASVRVVTAGLEEADSREGSFADLTLAPGMAVHTARGPGGAMTSRITAKLDTFTIGRASDNSIVVHDPMVSAHHARLVRLSSARYLVEDLRSTNGTFLDGERITRTEVGLGGIVSVGRVFLKVTSEGLERIGQVGRRDRDDHDHVPRTSLSVSAVTFSVDDRNRGQTPGAGRRKVLLDQVTFQVPERSLLAVIGPSGAGKSTMLKTMIGRLKPDSGQVLFDGLDMAIFARSLADRVGMVPQDDLVHPELSARVALEYAAKLRFPDDSTPAERKEAVEWALRELALTEHANTRISQLSGGQRKRVSTAIELLTKPDLLFLDEPTSGLDPNLDREVMELLRDLAHGTPQNPTGRTVVVITHSTDNLDKADNVLLLAPGGKVAFFGPPAELQPFFSGPGNGDVSYSSIYGLIARKPDWAQANFAGSALAQRPNALVPHAVASRQIGDVPRKRLLPQTLTLLSRQARLMVADRSLLFFTLALPIAMGLLTMAIRAEDGFNAATSTKSVGDPKILLVVVVFGSVLMGMVPSVRQLVGERSIFKHEAGVGLRPSAYLASKVVLLGVVCAIQSALLIAVTLVLNPSPQTGVIGSLKAELFVVAWGTAWSCAALGLLLSSLVATSEQVMPLMIVVLMLQLVMSGGVLNLLGPGINEMSMLAPARWAFAAGASSLDFNRNITCNAQVLVKAKEDEEVNRKAEEAVDEANQQAEEQAAANGMPAPAPQEAKVQHTVVDCANVDDLDPLWDHNRSTWLMDLTILTYFLVLYCGVAFLALRRLLGQGK